MHRSLVAVKMLHDKTQLGELLKEALVMARFDHPNVLRLVGVCTRGDPVLLVSQVRLGFLSFRTL